MTLICPVPIRLGWQQDGRMSVGSGLENPGEICYINSTLQALFHIPAFTNWLMSDKYHQQICQQQTDFQNDCIVCMVRDTFLMSQKHTGSSIKASSIINRLYLICKHLSTDHQEDAHEFYCYLIESMERCYLSGFEQNANLLNNNYSRETTPVKQIFGGNIRTEVTCGECGHISTSFQQIQELILDIQQSNTVSDALYKYFETEPVDEFYACERCQQKIVAVKKFSIEKAPNVLCVQLKRYSVSKDGTTQEKNSKAIQIEEQLDLTNYQFEYHKYKTDALSLRYQFVSMVIHHGANLNSGHYTALGLTSSGSYYYFNDSKVNQANFQDYSTSTNSYILFYELELSEYIRNTKYIENKTSTVTSTSDFQSIPSTLSESPVNEYFLNKSNGGTKLKGIFKTLNDANIVKKKKTTNKTIHNTRHRIQLKKRFKQGKPKDIPQTESELCTSYVTCNIKKDKKSKIDFVEVYRDWEIMRAKTKIQSNNLKQDPIKNVESSSIFG